MNEPNKEQIYFEKIRKLKERITLLEKNIKVIEKQSEYCQENVAVDCDKVMVLEQQH